MYERENKILQMIKNGPEYDIHEVKILSIQNKNNLKIYKDGTGERYFLELGENKKEIFSCKTDNKIYTEIIIDGSNDTVRYINTPIYIYGQYTKYSRNMSVTPMKIQGKLKYKRYVSEICDDLKEFYNAKEVKFRTAGREDADVRVTNRPFLCEVVEPKQNLYKKTILKKPDVEYNNVMRVTKDVCEYLTVGEGKTKEYEAMIFIEKQVNITKDEFIKKLINLSIKETEDAKDKIIIHQKTPLRVLHRRSNLLRKKAIDILDYNLKPSNEGTFILLKLRTDGGTYIKEFVNGDLGRTYPSASDIFSHYSDLIELDVTKVETKKINEDFILERW
ncbi:hypothetical protein SLOPH_1763 [Spraguea lophii 42_110]|uniref:tRNA pseudouridine(55) synthase n=1 Tax=Spraguea lophii (strain 42_110) TaxID=1358809 RepID=S7WE31_SPRLO|nr:hypothetical protein SLOPH_1763 [Spraguea lophii 42_110]